MIQGGVRVIFFRDGRDARGGGAWFSAGNGS